MKGVIVQIGDPKSIVLFNNGKIGAIPSPADCRIGMIVTVKLNNKLKILAITLAAVLLAGLGAFTGVSVMKGKAAVPLSVPTVEDDGAYDWQKGRDKMRELKQKFSE
jgi:hypothetical protein